MTRTRVSAWWLLIPVLLLAAAPAFGAEQAHKGPSEALFIADGAPFVTVANFCEM